MSKQRTFLDANVLIAVYKANIADRDKALGIIADPDREFVVSDFLELEVIPKTIWTKRPDQAEFFKDFFARAALRAVTSSKLFQAAFNEASRHGLTAVDALHIAGADAGNAELITAEKRTRPMYQTKLVKVRFLHDV